MSLRAEDFEAGVIALCDRWPRVRFFAHDGGWRGCVFQGFRDFDSAVFSGAVDKVLEAPEGIRADEVARELVKAGIAIAGEQSPEHQARKAMLRKQVAEGDYIEIPPEHSYIDDNGNERPGYWGAVSPEAEPHPNPKKRELGWRVVKRRTA